MWDGVTQWIVHCHNELTGVFRDITLADVQQQTWRQRDSRCFRSLRWHFVCNKLTGKEQSCVNWHHICKIQSRPQQLKPDVKCNAARYETYQTRPRLHSHRNSNNTCSKLPSCDYFNKWLPILQQISKFIILSSQVWVVHWIQPYSGYHRIDSVSWKPCYEGRGKGACLRGAKQSCPWTEPLAYFYSRSRYEASMTPVQ